jgi:hypothetical protein
MLIALICFFLPLMAAAGVLMGWQIRRADRRRLEEYRASPQSHILNLRD